MTESASRQITLPVVPGTAVVCPYLLAADRAWRASTATREHRCTAVAPAAILAPDKQRRLCLVADHVTCSTYLAATGQTESGDQAPPRLRPTARPVTRTTPLVLDHGRFPHALPSFLPDRGVGQGGLVALMAVAFGALVAARLSAGGPSLGPTSAGTAGTPAPSAVATANATAAPVANATAPVASATAPAATQTNRPQRTLVPSEVEPTATPADPPPAASEAPTTYTVKKGDTLSGIAGEFGTTWSVLAELNRIDDPGRLRVGQVLDLP